MIRRIEILYALCEQFKVGLISISNSTASRETDRLVADMLHRHPTCKAQKWWSVKPVPLSIRLPELAALEFPQLDVSLRGAVSIARRLQDQDCSPSW